MKAYIVLGLGFGDEGKGMVTDSLCLNATNPLCIRFNGGQQAGHTVAYETGRTHHYSSLGAGSLRGIPTYWSKYCTFSPCYFMCEVEELGIQPIYYLDSRSPITTHYDVLYNRAYERSRGDEKLGSSGMGHSTTVNRESDGLKFSVKSIVQESELINGLTLIRAYYADKFEKIGVSFNGFDHDKEDYLFINCVDRMKKIPSYQIVDAGESISNVLSSFSTFIFEGAQGILLDKEFGTKPYVTQSNTTSKNALEFIKENLNIQKGEIEIVYVTRAYLTRHGKGPFTECLRSDSLNKDVTDQVPYNEFQGFFKLGYLDIDLLRYSICCDEMFSVGCKKSLVVTCLDHMNPQRLPIIIDKKVREVNYLELPQLIGYNFSSVKYSFSKFSKDLR